MAENSKRYSSNRKCLAFVSCFDACCAGNDGGHFSVPNFARKIILIDAILITPLRKYKHHSDG
jgi:hypothetical protein